MKSLIALCFMAYFLYKYWPKNKAACPPELSLTTTRINLVLEELVMLGILADCEPSEDSAAYSFIPRDGFLFRPSIVDVAWADLLNDDPKDTALKIVKEWNKNDEIALQARAFSKSFVFDKKNSTCIPLLNSIKWVPTNEPGSIMIWPK